VKGAAGLLVALAASASAAQSTGTPSAPLAAWVELSPTGPVVRAITDAAVCPRAAAVDAAAARPAHWDTPMGVRAEPVPPDFPNRVCEWQPPPEARFIALEGQLHTLRMPQPNPERIVVIGDSGCWGAEDQNCVRDWPFPKIAGFAAARNPDLVIHLGDYNYRGTDCVAYDGCCTYNPINCGFPHCGDSWPNWQLDFFAPAAPLLAAAPWVFVRGNHDLCAQAGHGWFRYLDPHSPPPTCAANPVDDLTFTPPYPLYLGDSLRLIVLDSADACGQPGLRDTTPTYREQFERVAAYAADSPAAHTWLVAHRPLWGIQRYSPQESTVLNYTLQQASANHLPAAISLLLAGHEHLFQSLTMRGTDGPPTLIVGTGGAELDAPALVPSTVENLSVAPGGPTIAAARTLHDHGYLVIERSAQAWAATFYDRFNQPLATCASTARPALCKLAH
jgi:hypothetical protein